ncbi:MAG: NADPH-dependent 7-cyano-7-deazaguanine reductase QueF [bacterium]|jgi:7-cyano-7-deazaguanine reductase
MDIKTLKDKRFDIGGVELIDPSVLETLPYDHQPQDTGVFIETKEFTCVCPWSGLPDFATLRLWYFPDLNIIELKSFKYYLHTFRNVGIYQEDAVNRILNDFWECVQPKWIRMELDYQVRGGIHQVCTVVRGEKPMEVS